MTRSLHIGLLLMALLGLMGQSTAMAMVPAPMSIRSMEASMSGMDCLDMATTPAPGKLPCKEMTMQCMVAMGCVPLAFVEPDKLGISSLAIDRVGSALPLAARLWGRSYGPEPDPPSFLI